jgi:RNA polymerase sigma factor (sigma-70 family)
MDSAARGVGSTEDEVLDRMCAERVVGMIGCFLLELPVRQRELFDLIDLQGFTPAEVAEMLDMHPGTVRVHLFRARKRIRGWLLEHGSDLQTGSG